MSQSLADLTHALLDAAQKAGADAADAVAIEAVSLSIDVREGALEQASRSEATDIGLRVLIGQRQACVAASNTRPDTLTEMAERAVAMANEAPEDPHIGLADPAQLAVNTDSTGLELADPASEPNPDEIQAMALALEAAARAVPGITQVEGASAGYGKRHAHLALSTGFTGGYTHTSSSLSVSAIAGEGLGMERDYDYDARIFASDLRSPEEIGQTAGARAVARHGAKKPPTGTFPVLFDERISSSLVGHILQASNGATIARGSGWLREKLGQQILPDTLSITEDPHRARVPGSRLFDGEGLPTARRDIVADGILQGWTLDLATARKLGLQSTANATRGTASPPSPSVTNIALTQGAQSPAELMADMGTGLLITSLMGSTINPNTGDYSRGASGFWIEGGEIAYPVNECTIAGSLPEMLLRMIPSNDARPWLSRVVPSILIDGMVLAGA